MPIFPIYDQGHISRQILRACDNNSSHFPTHKCSLLLLGLPILPLLLYINLAILLKSPRRHFVQPQDRLVRILDKNILSVRHLQTHIADCAHDAPSIGEIKIHLSGEFAGFVAEDAEDDMRVCGLGVGAGDETVHGERLVNLLSFGARADVGKKMNAMTWKKYVPKFHSICLCKYSLGCPSCKLATIILHFRSDDGTPLAS